MILLRRLLSATLLALALVSVTLAPAEGTHIDCSFTSDVEAAYNQYGEKAMRAVAWSTCTGVVDELVELTRFRGASDIS